MSWKAVRGDVRIAARPAVLLLVIFMALFAGLCSMAAQKTQHSQFESAQHQVEKRSWEKDECGTDRASCMAIGQSDASSFLSAQTEGATRIGELQKLSGAIKFGSAFMALASGALMIVIIGTSLSGSEWRRETMKWAVESGYTGWQVAFRRFVVVSFLGVVSLFVVVLVLFAVGQIGADRWPLPGGDPSLLAPVFGVFLMIGFYSALVTWIGWLTRDALATFAYSLLVVAALAVSTPLSRWSPGSGVASLVGVERLSEPEIGYLWIWPEITFDRSGTAARIIDVPSWPVAALLAVSATCFVLVLVRRAVSTGDRIST